MSQQGMGNECGNPRFLDGYSVAFEFFAFVDNAYEPYVRFCGGASKHNLLYAPLPNRGPMLYVAMRKKCEKGGLDSDSNENKRATRKSITCR